LLRLPLSIVEKATRASYVAALLEQARGEFQQAMNLYEQARLIVAGTGDRAGEAAIIAQIAGVYRAMEKALSISREAGDREGEGVTLGNIGRVYDALAIREKQLGPEHPDTAQSLNNLAELYRAQGKYEQAEPLYQRALAIREKQLGPEHPYTATSLNNLAGLYRAQGKYEQAEPLYQRALAIREKQLGPEHP